jgi:hypothetical protein
MAPKKATAAAPAKTAAAKTAKPAAKSADSAAKKPAVKDANQGKLLKFIQFLLANTKNL